MKKEIPHPKIGVNVFVFKGKKILLGKRIGKTGYGTWCLPGGHFEWGESLASAAKRELLEETGLKAKNLEFLHLINDPRDSTHYVHINFYAKNWKGVPKVMEPDKFECWSWFDVKKIPKEIFIGHVKFIPAYFEKVVIYD
jgi:8-oxo-dGTP diphosphatase